MRVQEPISAWRPTRRGLLSAGAVLGAGTIAPGTRAAVAYAAQACSVADAGPQARDLDGAGEHTALGVWPRQARIALCGTTPVVTLPEHRAVAVLDRRTLEPRLAYALPGTPSALAAISAQRIVVAGSSWDSPDLTVIDLRAHRYVTRIHADSAPRSIAVAPGGRQALVVGGEDGGTVALVDLRTGRVIRRHTVGRVPIAVAWGHRASEAWVTLQGDSELVAIDPEARRIRRRIHLNFKPGALAVSPDGRHAALAAAGERGASIVFFDLRHGRRERTVEIGHYPGEMAFTRDGRHVVVTVMRGNELVRVGVGGRVWRTPTLPGPCGLALSGSHALVAGQNYVDVRRVRIR